MIVIPRIDNLFFFCAGFARSRRLLNLAYDALIGGNYAG